MHAVQTCYVGTEVSEAYLLGHDRCAKSTPVSALCRLMECSSRILFDDSLLKLTKLVIHVV